jgi:hypothetical protein
MVGGCFQMPHHPWHPKVFHVMKYPHADASEAENHERHKMRIWPKNK